MSNTVIKVENVSKQYRLGEVGTGSMAHDLNRWWSKIRGKEDPYLKIGEENDRTQKGESEYVWALQDINFEVKQGEVLGIVGRNGAGKSTLLKILSRTTAPTIGNVKIKGRMASLLEVGTGFHPDLSGRDNIFLNGTILGMTKREIKSKFDEIVEFSGVERYIDTPVKRYSSGMYVRLAFAVAAHLDPEILIVDEVLAVGDVEFQKKCLGKMKDVSVNDGRTILFVSHNVTALSNLCTKGILLNNGKLTSRGSISKVIDDYLGSHTNRQINTYWKGIAGNNKVKLLETFVKSKNKSIEDVIYTNDEIEISITIELLEEIEGLVMGFDLYSQHGYLLAHSLYDDNCTPPAPILQKGIMSKTFKIPPNTLSKGSFKIIFDVGIWGIEGIIGKDDAGST